MKFNMKMTLVSYDGRELKVSREDGSAVLTLGAALKMAVLNTDSSTLEKKLADHELLVKVSADVADLEHADVARLLVLAGRSPLSIVTVGAVKAALDRPIVPAPVEPTSDENRRSDAG